MEIALDNQFNNLSIEELNLINAGCWTQFAYALGGTLLIAGAPVVAALPGGGWIAAGEMLGSGIIMLGNLK